VNLGALLRQVDGLVFSAEPARALEPFERVVVAYDAAPDEDELDGLLTTFAYLLLQFDEYPGLPLDRTLQLLEDFERRHLAAGNSLRIVHYCRWTIARHLGDQEQVEAAYQAWIAAPRDDFAWCEGCEQISQVTHLVETARPAEAVQAAALVSSDGSCHRQSSAVPAALLPAYLELGLRDSAAEAHQVSYREIRDDPDELFLHAQHIRYCTLIGDQARADELIERHASGFDADVSRYDQLWFSVAAGLEEQALEIAAEFDRRNHSTYQSELARASMPSSKRSRPKR
jgi:hypothetical protein